MEELKQYDEEATSFDVNNQSSVEEEMPQTPAMEENIKTGNLSKATIATGVGAGVLLGSISTFMTSCAINAKPLSSEQQSEVRDDVTQEAETGVVPFQTDWSDGSMQIATTVNDDMTFSEAFSTSRGEVGAGGAFEWHGNVYGTYTAEEWNSMTPEQQNDFQSHFAWSSLSQNEADSSAEEDILDSSLTEDGTQNQEENNSVTDSVTEENAASNETETPMTDSDTPDQTVTNSELLMNDNIIDSSQMEIIGTVVDENTGILHGYVNVDGNDIMLSDVNGDQIFDVMASDVNHDGEISDDEQIDISSANVHVNDLDSNSTGMDSAYVIDDDTPDYINNADTSNYDPLG